ncbi:copper resistance protein CopC [Micromonospora maritima]|uniref:copper resistance protein CopC n=1 Tax=Micromonospora maritima TaxID=986711 RepID=UPI00378F27F8
MRTRVTAAFATLLTALLLAPATPAAAHNSLQSATPAQDARLTAAPTTVTLRFLQRLNPEFTTIVLSDADRRKVPTRAPAVDGSAGTVTVEQPLANGVYTVAYRVVSVDGHPVQGAYRFTVADPTAPTPSAAAGTPGAPVGADAANPASAADNGEIGPPLALIAGGLVAALAVAGMALLLLRRRHAA